MSALHPATALLARVCLEALAKQLALGGLQHHRQLPERTVPARVTSAKAV